MSKHVPLVQSFILTALLERCISVTVATLYQMISLTTSLKPEANFPHLHKTVRIVRRINVLLSNFIDVDILSSVLTFHQGPFANPPQPQNNDMDPAWSELYRKSP